MKKLFKGMNPTVFRLGIVSFFTDVASEMLYPITPIFLTSILGASMASVGLIEGVAEAIASLLKTYSGSWSDKVGKRKPFVVGGYLLAAISKPLIGASGNWLDVLFARGIDRVGKGIRTSPRDALIADSVTAETRGAAFGLHRAMDTMGAAVGPLFAILLLSYQPTNLRRLYYWALIPGIIGVLFALSIREPKSTVKKSNWQNPFSTWHKLDSSFHRYIWAWGIFSLANSSDVFLLMRAKNLGVSTTLTILLYCSYNLIYAVSSPWLGGLSDRIDRKKVLSFGLLVFALVYLGFGLVNQSWELWVLFLVYGLYMGATDGVGKALAVDFSPKELKGTTLGILATITGLCTIVASATAGLIWDHLGISYTFFFGACGAVIACGLLAIIPSRKS